MGNFKSKSKKSYSIDGGAPPAKDKDGINAKQHETVESTESIDIDRENIVAGQIITEQEHEVEQQQREQKCNIVNAQLFEADVNDTRRVPTWITEEYFVDIVKQQLPDFEKILKFSAFPALRAGENYATLMVRVSIDVQLKDNCIKHTSYMLKVPHDLAQIKEMTNEFNMFVPENVIYFELIPAFEEMYKAAGVNVTIAPKALKFTKDNVDVDYLLLEDLTLRDYENANRLECLDMEHTKSVLRKLAQFHAVSANYYAVTGALPKIFMEGLSPAAVKAFMIPIMNTFRDGFLNNIDGFKDGHKYKDVIIDYFEQIKKLEFIDFVIYNAHEFNVLNHADAWTNNVLFKYDKNGKIEDTLLVDFQLTKFGSPAADLMYFLLTSPKLDIKIQHFDHLIRYYYDELIVHLKILNYPKPLITLRELYVHLFKYGNVGTMSMFMTLGAVLLDPNENAQLESFISDSEQGAILKNMLYANKRYRDQVNELLPWLYNRGLFDLSHFSNEHSSTEAQKKTETNIGNEEHVEPKANANVKTDSNEGISIAKKIEEPLKKKEYMAKKETPIPEWLTEDYFVDILHTNIKNFKSIKKFVVTPGTNAGDNYASLMLQVNIDVELEDNSGQSVSYMLKVAPSDKHGNTMPDLFHTFSKEGLMYDKYIKEFEKIYKDVGVDITFGPHSYKFIKDPGCETVLLENLRPHGFKNVDRLVGLDLEHTECVLRKLAEFHAASAHFYVTKEKYPQLFINALFTKETRAVLEPMFGSFIELFLECVKTYKDSETYAHKLQGSVSSKLDKLIEFHSAFNEDGFNVLNHGDCWTNNIMFQYDDTGKIKNTYFVDYQLVKYGSPAQDLYYFLMSSPQLEVKLEQFDYCIKYYHEHLKRNLELLKYPGNIPTLKELHIDLLINGPWAFTTVTGVMSAVLLENTENADSETLFNNDEAGIELKKRMYLNKTYRRHAEALLLWLDRRGLIGNS